MTFTVASHSVRPQFILPLAPQRLLSLDVFRGMVIVAMLLVNNIGDPAAVGYFWKHVNWIQISQAEAYQGWWAERPAAEAVGGILGWVGQFPLFRHCTLADYVMPLFLLIIGVAMPFAVAARQGRGDPPLRMWLGVLRRAATLVVLGWTIGISLTILRWRHSTGTADPLQFTLGMDVLQLLGMSYLLARILYLLPLMPRIGAAMLMFAGHWAILRFYPQGDVPAGTFTAQHEAIGYIYRTWPIFQPVTLVPGRLSFSMAGMLSVIPAAATMLLGTWIGFWLKRQDLASSTKVKELLIGGMVCAAVGFGWAFDLPFNKPRWTPAYLLWCSGVGSMLLAALYYIVDMRGWRRWARFFIVFGVNSIAVYWLSIMTKIWTINMIRVEGADGETMMLTTKIVRVLQDLLNHPAAGSWAFTVLFLAFWWGVMEVAYRRQIFWKL
jgi:predicted acyltransferase